MPLTVKSIEAAKPASKPFKLSDAHGLYLYVSTAGSKIWRANFKVNGKNQTVTYGHYPTVGLADARRLNQSRKIESKKLPTFTQIFEEWLPVKSSELTNSKHIDQVEDTVRKHVLPDIGDLPINTIPRIQLIEVVQKLAHIPETAGRVAGRIAMVFDYAIDAGIIDRHGAADLSRVLPRTKITPMPSIPSSHAGKLLASIQTYNQPITRIGLMLCAHTFVRSGELLGMRWDEIKEGERVWVIPAERMKMRIPHVVPLSESVINLLRELHNYTGNCELVLDSPAKPGQKMSETTLRLALHRLGYRGLHTIHGFRALASSVLNEQSQFKEDVIERQLAHKESDKVRAAYNRAEFLPQRVELMNWWSNWLNEQLAAQPQTQTSNE